MDLDRMESLVLAAPPAAAVAAAAAARLEVDASDDEGGREDAGDDGGVGVGGHQAAQEHDDALEHQFDLALLALTVKVK